MFTFKGTKGTIQHVYQGETYTLNGAAAYVKALKMHVPVEGQPEPPDRIFILPLTGDDAYDQIEVLNAIGHKVDTLRKKEVPAPQAPEPYIPQALQQPNRATRRRQAKGA